MNGINEKAAEHHVLARNVQDFNKAITTIKTLLNRAQIEVNDATAIKIFERLSECNQIMDDLINCDLEERIKELNSEVKEIDFEKKIDEIIHELENANIGFKNVTISKKVRTTKRIVCDSLLLNVIIQSIIENSLREGSEVNKISIEIMDTSMGVKISISDDGKTIKYISTKKHMFLHGIKHNELEKAYSLIGLSEVYNSVRLVNGYIQATSSELGNTFVIDIPIIEEG